MYLKKINRKIWIKYSEEPPLPENKYGNTTRKAHFPDVRHTSREGAGRYILFIMFINLQYLYYKTYEVVVFGPIVVAFHGNICR